MDTSLNLILGQGALRIDSTNWEMLWEDSPFWALPSRLPAILSFDNSVCASIIGVDHPIDQVPYFSCFAADDAFVFFRSDDEERASYSILRISPDNSQTIWHVDATPVQLLENGGSLFALALTSLHELKLVPLLLGHSILRPLSFATSEPLMNLSVSPHGVAFQGQATRSLYILNADLELVRRESRLPDTWFEWSRDGSWVLAYGKGTGKSVTFIGVEPCGPTLTFSPASRCVAAAASGDADFVLVLENGDISRVRCKDKQVLWTAPQEVEGGHPTSLAVSAQSGQIVVGYQSGEIIARNDADGHMRWQAKTRSGSVESAAPCGGLFAIIDERALINIFDENGKQLLALIGHNDTIRQISRSTTSCRLMSIDKLGVVTIWSISPNDKAN